MKPIEPIDLTRHVERVRRPVNILLIVCTLLYTEGFMTLCARAAEHHRAPTLPTLPVSAPISFQDPVIHLQTILDDLSFAVGLDHHPIENKLVLSHHYPTGFPHVFELLDAHGERTKYTGLSGLTEEIKIAVVQEDRGGFQQGTLFSGTGRPGEILRVSPDGSLINRPWVVLPNEPGILRGSLYVDRTGVFGGDLIAVTTAGNVWRINARGEASILARFAVHLEGVITLPDDPARYGPAAGKILLGNEQEARFQTVDAFGNVGTFELGIAPEDIDVIPAGQNFYIVSSSGELFGVPASEFAGMEGDLLVTKEQPPSLHRLRWDGARFVTQLLWRFPTAHAGFEHGTFSPIVFDAIRPPGIPTIACSGPVSTEADSPAGKSVTLTAQVADTDCEVLRVTWNVDGGPVEGVEDFPAHPTIPSGGASSFEHVYPVGTHRVTATVIDPQGHLAFCETSVTITELRTFFLAIDDDSVKDGAAPNFFGSADVNKDLSEIGQRSALRAFSGANVGSVITLHTGQVGDEGWFALKTIPQSWAQAGPTADGLRNFVGGLGGSEALLDKVPDVTPLRAAGLKMLEGLRVCAVVFESDVSMNYDPLNGSLKGKTLGTVAFKVRSVTRLEGASSSSLPKVEVEIIDPVQACQGPLRLLTDAPAPTSSSEPMDVDPPAGQGPPTQGGAAAAPESGGFRVFPRTARILEGRSVGYTMTAPVSVLESPPSLPAAVAQWKADGDARDSIGANDGTLEGGAGFALGHEGQAFAFDGVDDFVSVPDSPLWAFAGDFSIETRVEFDTVRPGPRTDLPNVLVAHDEGAFGGKWVLLYAEDGFFFYGVNLGFGGGFIGPFRFAPEPGQFHHVVLTRTGVTYRLYVDGVVVGNIENGVPIADVVGPLTIGQAEGIGFLDGRIDGLSIYGAALSAEQVRRTYGGMATLAHVDPPVAAWPAEGTAEDVVGGNDGVEGGGLAYLPGRVGSAFSLDGIDDHVTVARAPLDTQFVQSVEAWINPEIPPTGEGWIYANRQPGAPGFSVLVTSDGRIGLEALATHGLFATTSPPGTIRFGQFQHVAVASVSFGIPQAYVDGVPVVLSGAPLPGNGFVIPPNLEIGRRQSPSHPEGTAGARHYKGLIDELRLYDRVLTGDEVGAIVRISSSGVTPFVVWRSALPGVASIGLTQGNADALSGGMTAIQATRGLLSASASLEVIPLELVSIDVLPASGSLVVGQSRSFSAIGTFSDCSKRDITRTAGWAGAEAEIATVRGDALATAVGAGQTQVVASQAGVTGSAALAVEMRRLDSIRVTPVNQTVTVGGGIVDRSVQADPPVGEWKAQGNADDTAGANHGTLQGDAGFAPGLEGLAFSLDGAGDYVSVPDSPLWTFGADFSIELRAAFDTVRTGSRSQFQNVLVAHDTGGGFNNKWAFHYAEDGLFFLVGNSFIGPFRFDPVPGRPYHVVLTRTGDNYSVYVDGTLLNTIASSIPIPDAAAPLTIGQAEGLGFFDGLLDEVRIYHSALSQDQIRTRFAGIVPILGQYRAVGTFNDGTTEDISASAIWTSSDPQVAFIQGIGGQVTALSPGTVRIEALKDGVTGFTLLTVIPRTLVSLVVTPDFSTMAAGETRQFTATGTFNDAGVEDLTTRVTWTSTAPAVASVTVSGLARGASAGNTAIEATFGGVTAGASLAVFPAALVSIAVEPSNLQAEAGDTIAYTAVGTFSDGSTAEITGIVTWSSSAPSVAAIDSGGSASALALGITTIRAQIAGVSGETFLTVVPLVPLLSVTVTPATASIAAGLSVQFTATGLFNDASTRDITRNASWTSGSAGVASVDSTGRATGLSPGASTIFAVYKGITGSANLTVGAPPPPPTVEILSPAPDSIVTEAVAVTGSASAPYTLAFRSVDGGAFTTIATGNPVSGGFLGTFDPTVLENGIYTIRLTARDALGQRVSTEIQVIVEGAVKLGLFTLTFNDLTVPVHGIPLTVNRVYDSRVKTRGDFGVGWRLEFNTVKIQTNKKPGQGGWVLGAIPPIDGGIGFLIQLPGSRLSSFQPHYVTVRFQDGRTENFDFVGDPEPQIGSTFVRTPTLAPRPGTVSRLEALGDDGLILIDGDLLDFSFRVYDPTLFRLTTKDGTAFLVRKVEGVFRIIDTSGNSVEITPEGLTHSAGVSVSFVRDFAGRIERIVDPMSKEILYAYDANGDLASSTDRQLNTTGYTYLANHYLRDILDPLGRRPIRNEYDIDGRLTATIDADGRRIELTHLPGARQEIVDDRAGNRTVIAYDFRGNVIAQTNALGHTTTSTYDFIDNETSRTDELGNVTFMEYDNRRNVVTETRMLGGRPLVTRRTYDFFGGILTQVDPLGQVTANTYDGRGNLLTSTDALGNVNRNFYDGFGRLAATLDPAGTATESVYSKSGNVVEQRTLSGGTVLRKTTFGYDFNGNQVERTEWNGSPLAPYAVTRSLPDANGRIVHQVDPLGHSSFTSYNAAGQQISTTDKDGNVTRTFYNARGLLERTEYPIGAETIAYDFNGNRVGFTNRDGHTTATEYDVLNRPVKVTNPDGSFRRTVYDAAGRVSQEIDERGMVTAFEYDALGRRTATVDAAGGRTLTSYDDAGRQRSVTDPRGFTTQFAYDAAGRQIATIFPDGTVRSTAYDELGRRVSETDEVGITRAFEYLATGELSAVLEPNPFDARRLSTVTSFGYDALGRKLTQTDAAGRTTVWTHTLRGEVATRSLPLGQTESFTYTPGGQVHVHARFDGSTVAHSYDAANRLAGKAFSGGGFESYGYTAGGLRNFANVNGDIWTFGFDSRNRLVLETKPNGASIGYGYDAAGNRTNLVTATQSLVYAFDELNRPVGVRNASEAQFLATAGFDANGNLAFRTYANNTQAVYAYNAKNQLSSVVNSGPGGSIVSSYAYTVDPSGKRTNVTEHSGRNVAYGYDALGRLAFEQIANAGSVTMTVEYTYDRVGNRISKKVSSSTPETVSYAYNANDELVTESSTLIGVKNYAYTPNGETASISGSGGTQVFGWDHQSRLVAYAGSGGTGTVRYDPDGIRWLKSVGATVTTYLVDRNQAYQQVLEDRVAGAVTATYVYLDDLVAAGFPGSGTRFYHYDGQMSTRQLTDSAAAVSDEYTFDAFGVTLAATGSTPNNYLYTGEQFDPNLGFQYNRARYLSLSTGRFLSQDHFSGIPSDPISLHRYLYANSDGINRRDPSGLFTLVELVVVSAIILILVGILISIYESIDIDVADLEIHFSAAMVTASVQYDFEAILRRASFPGILLVTWIPAGGPPGDIGEEGRPFRGDKFVVYISQGSIEESGYTLNFKKAPLANSDTVWNTQLHTNMINNVVGSTANSVAIANILAHEILWHHILGEDDLSDAQLAPLTSTDLRNRWNDSFQSQHGTFPPDIWNRLAARFEVDD